MNRHSFLMAVLGLFIPAAMLPARAAPASGLLAHWKCDEGRGDVLEDSSGRGNSGDITGGAWASGAFGTALQFRGGDSFASVPEIPSLDGSNELTLEVWVLWEGGGRYPNILTGGQWAPGGFMFFVSDTACSFRMGRPGSRPDQPGGPWQEISAPLVGPFETGKWYHLAATFRRPEITTFVNGRKVGSARWDFPLGYAGPLEIGRWAGPACHRGLIDEIKLYNRALAAGEIAASHAAEAPRRIGPVPPVYRSVPATARAIASLENSLAKLEIDQRGRCTALVEKRSGRNLLAAVSPLVTLQAGGRLVRPTACTWNDGKLKLEFGPAGPRATLACAARDRYFTFTLEGVEGGPVESMSFVSLTVQNGEQSSSTSGAVSGPDWSVCLRAANLQSSVELRGAPPVLRAVCTSDHGLTGARAALVAGPRDQLRPALQELVKAENLPQSALGGPWALESEEIRGSYLFGHPGERDVERWIDLAKRGGFTHLHHENWYRTLGHYEPRESLFPKGLAGIKEMVRKIHDAGLKAGMHTLTGCIDPRDPWVTPVPDKRLAADASYTLAGELSDTADTLLVQEKPEAHDVIWSYSGRGNALRIGDEIIQYAAISSEPPYAFLKCTRGAFHTKPAAHRQGERVDHLRQIYLAFYPDERSTLVGEVADAIARVYNECEFDQIYMDGAEGMGTTHGIEVMRDAIYRRLRRPAVVEASAWDHWSWYYHSRIGAWDHPKWGLKPFTDLHAAAIANYREGALLQAQLGWWVVLGASASSRAETPDEMEYFCAKTLGFDAPSSTQGIGSLSAPANARMQEYITMAGWYERLRLANYFPESVKKQLREPGKDFHLVQGADGHWQLLPTDYVAHKVTGLNDGSAAWQVENRFAEQPLNLRVEALHAVTPYDSSAGVLIAAPQDAERFAVHRSAAGVSHALERSAEQVKLGGASFRFTATSRKDTARGAWAHAGLRFERPYLSIEPCDALGVWVHGDGKGEVLNLQLTSPREYMAAYGEHYVTIDFTGWRYFEMPLRERDAARHRDYEWPYASPHGIYMVPVNRGHIDGLNLYLNNLPPKDTATVFLGPVKALRTTRVQLGNPVLTINGQRLALPITLASGDYVEMESMNDCRVYDERGTLLDRLVLPGAAPLLKAGGNRLVFSCDPPAGGAARAEVTVRACGPALTERSPDRHIRWALLRDEYDKPRVITRLDGRDNNWNVLCPPGASSQPCGVEIDVESVNASDIAYRQPGARTLESFDDASFTDDPKGRIVSAKAGVTQSIRSSRDRVKIGSASACYTATSSLPDNGGWSVHGKHLPGPLDLSKAEALGFWLYGDGKGEAFKLQLRDEAGGWCDMVTSVDFTGWRYQQFDFERPGKLDRSRVRDLLIYYNSIPASQTVTCWVDDIRAVPRLRGLRQPQLAIAGRTLSFPVELFSGDRLVYDGNTCRVHRKPDAAPEIVAAQGGPLRLPAGTSPVALTFAPDQLPEFRVAVSLVKHHAGDQPR